MYHWLWSCRLIEVHFVWFMVCRRNQSPPRKILIGRQNNVLENKSLEILYLSLNISHGEWGSANGITIYVISLTLTYFGLRFIACPNKLFVEKGWPQPYFIELFLKFLKCVECILINVFQVTSCIFHNSIRFWNSVFLEMLIYVKILVLLSKRFCNSWHM